jgi:hypothetical protein
LKKNTTFRQKCKSSQEWPYNIHVLVRGTHGPEHERAHLIKKKEKEKEKEMSEARKQPTHKGRGWRSGVGKFRATFPLKYLDVDCRILQKGVNFITTTKKKKSAQQW